jgi:hypothetical protein
MQQMLLKDSICIFPAAMGFYWRNIPNAILAEISYILKL